MIYTIGHSNLDIDDFLTLIEPVDIIIDVRSHPGSKWPQFQHENLSSWLPQTGKQYFLDLRLGGWREDHLKLADQFMTYNVDVAAYAQREFPKQRIARKLPKQSTPSWWNLGFWDYQFFMMLDEFYQGIRDLILMSKSNTNIGLLCSECLWWKCHRSMISDFLLGVGYDSVHLQPKLTQHSKVINNRLARYHHDVISRWEQLDFIHTT